MMEFFRLGGIAYHMATLAESAEALREAGFGNVEIRTRMHAIWSWRSENSRPWKGHCRIVGRIGPERARHFIDNWRQMVIVLQRGELRPAHLKELKRAQDTAPDLWRPV
ncbi:MAG: hypothetical protein NVS1B6_11100 [Steroidobacteraceae bacterium]